MAKRKSSTPETESKSVTESADTLEGRDACVTHYPPACPRCGGIHYETTRSQSYPRQIFYDVKTRVKHHGQRRQWRKCKACGQHYIVRSPMVDNSKT